MTHSVEQFVKQFDNSSNLSDIHTSVDLKELHLHKITGNKLQKLQQLKRAKDMN